MNFSELFLVFNNEFPFMTPLLLAPPFADENRVSNSDTDVAGFVLGFVFAIAFAFVFPFALTFAFEFIPAFAWLFMPTFGFAFVFALVFVLVFVFELLYENFPLLFTVGTAPLDRGTIIGGFIEFAVKESLLLVAAAVCEPAVAEWKNSKSAASFGPKYIEFRFEDGCGVVGNLYC